MSTERVLATYLIETPYPVEDVAEVLAGEQSSGTFTQVPGETEDLRERFRARVERIQDLDSVETPSLPGALSPGDAGASSRYGRAEVTVSWSLENMGTNLPTLQSTVLGNLSELRELSGLRLLDVELPPAFAEAHPGPRFGIGGTRELVGVYDGPVIGTIIKPSVGMSPQGTAELVRDLAEGGIDFIKDDELMANPPHSPLEERVEAVMGVINGVADRTGKKVMYAFNITDDLDAMLRHHETVLNAGGTCVMVSVNSVGLVGVSHLRRHAELPIHGHRNSWGLLTRYPYLGMEFAAYQKLWRLAGVDHLHVNALQSKFWEPDESVVRSINACLKPMFAEDDRVMPVLSSGQWGGQAPDTYRSTGSTDYIYLAGAGIVAHPGGPAAGVTAIRQAWEAAVKGIPLREYAEDHRELMQSLEKFGKLRQAADRGQ
ncbi:MAG: Ribulose bisphosphate carboxylase large chain [uncultured Rubrobacteraceae bacterium]|uniref:Ribulose bisphosphate carboxylase large chain n=1 Tax=uncultured Rubrobacteraceae bacterium TaxID=349277 RepID=A0A6J4S0N0_9ACTN|nr:MAG: Ribulose bisphosphate carboxylase large chain [uncultured Rubrobacteraceae bacterium]